MRFALKFLELLTIMPAQQLRYGVPGPVQVSSSLAAKSHEFMSLVQDWDPHKMISQRVVGNWTKILQTFDVQRNMSIRLKPLGVNGGLGCHSYYLARTFQRSA